MGFLERKPIYVGAAISPFTCRLAVLSSPLTVNQICDLPPGTISDIVNEHNLTVHWTEKHTHRDCALYTGEPSVDGFIFMGLGVVVK